MGYREFIDSLGISWKVWNTAPVVGAVLTGEMRHGWLTFQSITSRRRLAPVPTEWEQLTAEQLEQLCRGAFETPGAVDRSGEVGVSEPDLGRQPENQR